MVYFGNNFSSTPMIPTYLLIAALIFVSNVVPLFMPATWTIITYIAVVYQIPILPLAIVGAVSATLGRSVLAKLSQVVLRQKFIKDKTRKNIDVIRKKLEGKKLVTSASMLLFAFSPFPSSQLFIAYGLTKLKLRYVVIPFLIGRLCSYTFFAFSAQKLTATFFPFNFKSMMSSYFIIGQVLGVIIIYFFTQIDWNELLTNRKLKRIE